MKRFLVSLLGVLLVSCAVLVWHWGFTVGHDAGFHAGRKVGIAEFRASLFPYQEVLPEPTIGGEDPSEDPDTIIEHVPEADIGDEILEVNGK